MTNFEKMFSEEITDKVKKDIKNAYKLLSPHLGRVVTDPGEMKFLRLTAENFLELGKIIRSGDLNKDQIKTIEAIFNLDIGLSARIKLCSKIIGRIEKLEMQTLELNTISPLAE